MEFQTTVSSNEPITVTIGNFDGIHRGHQRLLHELSVMAREVNSKPVLITFSPHTLLVIRPNSDLQCLTTLAEKLALARTYGHVADSIVISFTQEVANLSAFDFLESLRARFLIKGIIVGEDFKLGHNRMGNVSFLQEYGREHEILVRPVQLEEMDAASISSTRIRGLVSEGKIREANELLGHPVIVSGIVVEGDKRGRTLGYPTANLEPEPHKLLPAYGIYAAHVSVEKNAVSGDQTPEFDVYNSAVSVGVRPQFDGKKCLVEAFLLDVQRNLYGKRIIIDFIARLRDELRFSSVEALKEQMAADVALTRQILGQEQSSPYKE